MSAHGARPLPGPGDTPSSPEYLALRARLHVALLLAELARLKVKEHEVLAELREFTAARDGAPAAAELAAILERISRGVP